MEYKRYNSGFIDLDYYLGITFSDIKKRSDIRYLKEPNVIEFMISNTDLIYKSQSTIEDCYNELLAYQLANAFGIKCAFYDLATFDATIGVLTPNFKKVGIDYYTLGYLFDNYDLDTNQYKVNLENIWNILEKRYNANPEHEDIVKNLMHEIIRIYCFNLLIRNSDCHLNNMEIAEDKTNNQYFVAPIFDHTFSFDLNWSTSRIAVSYEDGDHTMFAKCIKDFLNVSDSYFQDMFIDMNEKFTIELLNECLKNIEIQTGRPVPNDIRKSYEEWFIKHKSMINNVLQEFNSKKR